MDVSLCVTQAHQLQLSSVNVIYKCMLYKRCFYSGSYLVVIITVQFCAAFYTDLVVYFSYFRVRYCVRLTIFQCLLAYGCSRKDSVKA